MVEKGKISGCFKNSISVVLQQCQNKISLRRKGSDTVSKCSLYLFKSKKCSLMNRKHCQSFKIVIAKILIRRQNHFFGNLLDCDVGGEQ